MQGIIGQNCCCTAPCEKDCIWQTEIESGCCHKDDVLLLWCGRPGWTDHQNYSSGPSGFPSTLHEFCCNTHYAGYAPVQAIYHFYDCFWRCIKIPTGGIQYIETMPAICPQDTESSPCVPVGEGPCEPGETDALCQNFWNSTLYPLTAPCNAGCAPKAGCCNEVETENCQGCCNCNTKFMSDWRLRVSAVTPRFKWLVETTCHNDGINLGQIGGVGGCTESLVYNGNTLYNCGHLRGQALCMVHMERWWKIAEDCGVNKIYVPGCTNASGEVSANCDGVNYQTDDLVPKWWFFACSGIPLYIGDLIDAVRFGYITAQEAEDLLAALEPGCTHPKQATLNKLAVAGYIRSNDWRDEQRLAYVELHAKFPTAGYGAHIQSVESMAPLGPFRKRMTKSTTSGTVQPLLRKANVAGATDLIDLQATGFINYPGSIFNQADYDYWCHRQWVYFRGRPGGWEWGGWAPLAEAGGVCDGQGEGGGVTDEEMAILLGYGRGDNTCIDAFRGQPLGPPTQSGCACCNTSMPGVIINCYNCNPPPTAPPTPVTSCGATGDNCDNLMFFPICEGMHIMSNAYENEHNLVPDGEQCKQCTKTQELYTTHSFLIEGKRQRDSWLDSVPFTCRTEKPPLPALNLWADWPKSHAAPFNGVCTKFFNFDADAEGCWCPGATTFCGFNERCQAYVYTNRMACGGYCADYRCRCDPETFDPVLGYEVPFDPTSGFDAGSCAARSDCPPHITTGQTDCIGYTPECGSP